MKDRVKIQVGTRVGTITSTPMIETMRGPIVYTVEDINGAIFVCKTPEEARKRVALLLEKYMSEVVEHLDSLRKVYDGLAKVVVDTEVDV